MTKSVTIVVNGRELQVPKEDLSFEEIANLAFNDTASANTIFTITYKRGQGHKPEGSLVKGDSVKVKEGMIFNVTRTDKS